MKDILFFRRFNHLLYISIFSQFFLQKSGKACWQNRKNIKSSLRSYQSDSIFYHETFISFLKIKKKVFHFRAPYLKIIMKWMSNHRFSRSLSLTFNVTWVKAGSSSVLGLESLRELRVQGAVGMGNGLGPSLTQGGRKMVLCGGWPPAPGIFA